MVGRQSLLMLLPPTQNLVGGAMKRINPRPQKMAKTVTAVCGDPVAMCKWCSGLSSGARYSA